MKSRAMKAIYKTIEMIRDTTESPARLNDRG